MTAALLFVLTDPGELPEADFHAWYDRHHGPARLAVPGIRAGARYRAADGARPPWLACYDTDTATLAGPAYRALRAHRSPADRAVLPRLAALDRRVYELTAGWGDPPDRPAPLLVCTSLSSTDPAGLDAWYAAEHVPLLRAVPGWGRIRRYRLRTGDAPAFLAVHELDGPAALDHPAYRHAVSTPWRERVMATVAARERRVFALHRTIAARRGSEPLAKP